jgi:hypothetical protein
MIDFEYFQQAKTRNDVSLCESIKDELSKEQCITIITQN